MPPIRVAVVSDDPLARGGLALLLSDRPEVSVVAQATGPEELGEDAPADVLVWDFDSAPASSRGEPEGRAAEPRDAVAAGVPILAVLADESQAPQALAAGARGLVFRGVDAGKLSAAVVALASGLTAFDEELSAALLQPPTRAEVEGLVEELTARELEVLQLLAQGLTNRRIAERLGISDHTAKFHVNAILGKLGAASRTEAVVQASRRGLVIL